MRIKNKMDPAGFEPAISRESGGRPVWRIFTTFYA